MIVTSARELEDVCGKLRSAGSFGVDTEFVRERTYYIRLGILQVACPGLEAVLDPHVLESLEPFFELICDATVQKVVHAGVQDFSVLFDRIGEAPRGVFDTQIAAALVGYGEQLSYAKLVQKVTGVKLSKLETLTDWTARPLSRAQVTYALEDVRHLPTLRDHLAKRLTNMGRMEWAREEFQYLEDPATYSATEPDVIFTRIRPASMDGHHLAVLRELVAWREGEAQSRDIPRGWVLKDQALVELARRAPTSVDELRQIRFVKSHEVERSGTAILESVRRGLESPWTENASRGPSARVRSRAKPIVRLLDAWLQARAAEAKIAPSLVTTKEQLKNLVEGHLKGKVAPLPILSGWRRELVGRDLMDILNGTRHIYVDSETGRLSIR